MRGAITICITIIIVVIIIAMNRVAQHKEMSQELNREYNIEPTKPRVKLNPHEFDPNIVDLRGLLDMGLTKAEALSLIKYRASGKIFRIKEEVISCHGVSDSLYFALEPYIVIGEEFQYRRKTEYSDSQRYLSNKKSDEPRSQIDKRVRVTPSAFLIDTVSVEYLTAIGALSQRQAKVFVKWRDMSDIETLEDIKACYTVSDSIAEWLAQYAIFTPKERATELVSKESVNSEKGVIELNSADSITLVSIYGIGAKSASAIIEYREKLGGFHSAEQLLEIKAILESNFEKIITQISIDNSVISKIDVNFATAKQLSRHPYLTPLMIRRLLKIRELKGGWRTIEEMIESNIFTTEEALRVRPYLHFEVQDPNI